MRHMIRLLCLFSVWSLVCLTSSCAKEKPPWELPPVITLSGGVIAPASPQENIRMDSMEIKLRLNAGSYDVDAAFHLFNTGEATTEWIGFPKQGKTFRYVSDPNHRVVREFIRFEGWVNGRKELFREKRPFLRGNSCSFPEPTLTDYSQETRWMAKKIVFPQDAFTTVRIRYEAPYSSFRERGLPGDIGLFHIGPRQYWKGRTATAEIVVENPADTGFKRTITRLRVSGTEVGKKTITNTRITYELKEGLSGNGVLRFEQFPDRKFTRVEESGDE
jgi:hypothetical protein